jgi:hypothetical protein
MKLILILSILAGHPAPPTAAQQTEVNVGVNTTTIQKSEDSQGVDVIWLEACIHNHCGSAAPAFH